MKMVSGPSLQSLEMRLKPNKRSLTGMNMSSCDFTKEVASGDDFISSYAFSSFWRLFLALLVPLLQLLALEWLFL